MAIKIQEEIEDKLIDCITKESAGRMVVVKPENSKGILIAEKKGYFKDEKHIILSVHNGSELDEKPAQIVLLSAADKDFLAGKIFYLVFTKFNIIKQDIEDNFWVIPSLKIKEVKNEKDLQKFLIDRKGFVRLLMESL